jgi:hypothetical protein
VTPGHRLLEQPLDYMELPSVYSEVMSYSEATHKALLPHATSKQLQGGKMNIFWMLKILRGAAVYQALHSSAFNPDSSSPAQLQIFARKVAQRFWPTKLPPNFDALAEAALWMASGGETRLAYLRNYVKAFSFADQPIGSLAAIVEIPPTDCFATQALAGAKPPHPLLNFKIKIDSGAIAKKLMI